MANTAIGFGVALIVVGVAGFAATGAKTSLIPAAVGVLLAICGFVAMNPAYRKHAMHAAAVIGLLGFLAAAGRLIPAVVRGTLPATAALVSLVLMMLLTGAFVVLCVRSFIVARRQVGTESGAAPRL